MESAVNRKFRTVGVGGTFDELHKGHKTLLLKAFEVGEHVIVGMSTDQFVRQMGKPQRTASYKQRLKELGDFLDKHGLLQRAEVVPISDAYGGLLLSNDPIEALIVSRETEPTAAKINEKRREIGLTPLQIIVIDMIPSENHSPISTTRIRRGEIDREGHLLKR